MYKDANNWPAIKQLRNQKMRIKESQMSNPFSQNDPEIQAGYKLNCLRLFHYHEIQ